MQKYWEESSYSQVCVSDEGSMFCLWSWEVLLIIYLRTNNRMVSHMEDEDTPPPPILKEL